MQYAKAIRQMVARSNKSMRTISVEIGRSPNFLNASVGRGPNFKIETLLPIADACGYDVALLARDGSDSIVLDSGE